MRALAYLSAAPGLGARAVVAYCTHAVLSGPAVENIENSALDELVVRGVETSIPVHRRIVRHEAFRSGDLSIRFLEEHLSPWALLRLYREAGAFVLPSRGEGWGLPYMEALLMECPVIACRSSSIAKLRKGDSIRMIRFCLFAWLRGRVTERCSIEFEWQKRKLQTRGQEGKGKRRQRMPI